MKSEEIARIAGVSRSTVSRVINNYPNVPEKTRELVMKVVREYQYEPNMSARVLAGKRTNTIGLFLLSIYDIKSPYRIYGNNYFAPFVDALVDIGNSMGYYTLVRTIYKPEECWRIRQTYSQKRIDGGIIIGTEKNQEVESLLSRIFQPLVLLDYDPQELSKLIHPKSKIAVINSDDEKGIYSAVDYLVSLGHTEIGMIEGRTSTYSGLRRRQSFLRRLEYHGLPIHDCHMVKGDFTGETTVTEIKKLINRGNLPTALIASNDEMALAAIETFKAHGIRTPEDISIIGYDDAPGSAIVSPPLTTVRLPFFEMSKKAFETLTQLIETDSPTFRAYNTDVGLVARKSCTKKTY